LVRLKPGTTQLKPELAEQWDSPDGKVWTIELRKNVKWHDGSDFVAEDVIYSIERTQDPNLGHKLKKQFQIVEKVEKLDDHTVRVTLKKTNPGFMSRFTEYNMSIVSHRYDYAKLAEGKPMGTGPFMVKQIVPKEGGILVKNPNYWMSGKPLADEIHWTWVADYGTRFTLLTGGDADLVRAVNPTDALRAQAHPNLKIYNPFHGRRIIYMRTDNGPFKDNRVRLALKYCLDHEIMAKALRCELDKNMYISESPMGPIYNDYLKIAPRGKDIIKAKKLLAEAGFPQGFDVDLYFATSIDWSQNIALVVKEMAAPAGIRINLKGTPRSVYLSQHWLKVDFGITAWAPRVDPTMGMSLAYKTGAAWNETHYSNPELDQLIDQISVEMNAAKRKEMYSQLQKLFYEEGPIVNVWVPRYHALNKKLHGYSDDFTNIGDWREATLK
jgi:peptide/nickel transport system substrate-binding protein